MSKAAEKRQQSDSDSDSDEEEQKAKKQSSPAKITKAAPAKSTPPAKAKAADSSSDESSDSDSDDDSKPKAKQEKNTNDSSSESESDSDSDNSSDSDSDADDKKKAAQDSDSDKSDDSDSDDEDKPKAVAAAKEDDEHSVSVNERELSVVKEESEIEVSVSLLSKDVEISVIAYTQEDEERAAATRERRSAKMKRLSEVKEEDRSISEPEQISTIEEEDKEISLEENEDSAISLVEEEEVDPDVLECVEGIIAELAEETPELEFFKEVYGIATASIVESLFKEAVVQAEVQEKLRLGLDLTEEEQKVCDRLRDEAIWGRPGAEEKNPFRVEVPPSVKDEETRLRMRRAQQDKRRATATKSWAGLNVREKRLVLHCWDLEARLHGLQTLLDQELGPKIAQRVVPRQHWEDVAMRIDTLEHAEDPDVPAYEEDSELVSEVLDIVESIETAELRVFPASVQSALWQLLGDMQRLPQQLYILDLLDEQILDQLPTESEPEPVVPAEPEVTEEDSVQEALDDVLGQVEDIAREEIMQSLQIRHLLSETVDVIECVENMITLVEDHTEKGHDLPTSTASLATPVSSSHRRSFTNRTIRSKFPDELPTIEEEETREADERRKADEARAQEKARINEEIAAARAAAEEKERIAKQTEDELAKQEEAERKKKLIETAATTGRRRLDSTIVGLERELLLRSQMERTPAHDFFPEFIRRPGDSDTQSESGGSSKSVSSLDNNSDDGDRGDADEDEDEGEEAEDETPATLFAKLKLPKVYADAAVHQELKVSELAELDDKGVTELIARKEHRKVFKDWQKEYNSSLKTRLRKAKESAQQMTKMTIPVTIAELFKQLKIPGRFADMFEADDKKMSDLPLLKKEQLNVLVPKRGPRNRLLVFMKNHMSELKKMRPEFLKREAAGGRVDKLMSEPEYTRWLTEQDRVQEETRAKLEADKDSASRGVRKAWDWDEDELEDRAGRLEVLEDHTDSAYDLKKVAAMLNSKNEQVHRWTTVLRAAERGHASLDELYKITKAQMSDKQAPNPYVDELDSFNPRPRNKDIDFTRLPAAPQTNRGCSSDGGVCSIQ